MGRDEPGGRKKCEAPRVRQPLVDRLSPKMQAKLTLLVRNRAQSDTTGTGVDVLLECPGVPWPFTKGFMRCEREAAHRFWEFPPNGFHSTL